MKQYILNEYIQQVYSLKKHISVVSNKSYDPVEVDHIPKPWVLIGKGNYASVFLHPDYPTLVVKIYAEGKKGYKKEVEVYRKLGKHKRYSECFYANDNFLILKYLKGITLYDSVHKGIKIPEKVIEDIDDALNYARKQGLRPHDIHGKNIMMYKGRGYVVDVSDFYKEDKCDKWEDLRKAYYKIYRYTFFYISIPIPYIILNLVRKGYRIYRKIKNAR